MEGATQSLPDYRVLNLVFLFCCLAPPPGRGSLRGALCPPFGFAFGALGLALWVSLWGSWGRVGAAFGAPLVPPLAPPWGWDQRRYNTIGL